MRAPFCCVLIALTARGNDLPKKLDFDRYKAMLEHSPFAIASAVAVPAETPSFAKDLYVANAAKSADGDMVTIASTSDKEFKKYLTTKGPVDGYVIVSIRWSDRMGKTKVTIIKDGQFATLTVNQMVQAQPVPNRPSPIAQPAFPESGFQKSIGLPTPSPRTRGVIQRNSSGANIELVGRRINVTSRLCTCFCPGTGESRSGSVKPRLSLAYQKLRIDHYSSNANANRVLPRSIEFLPPDCCQSLATIGAAPPHRPDNKSLSGAHSGYVLPVLARVSNCPTNRSFL
jgi:hypothetical protein